MNLNKALKINLFLIAAGFCLMNSIGEANAALDCDNLQGNWSGSMKGLQNGATSMTIKSRCRIKWKLPDGRTNNCRYKEKSGKVEYSCSLGSRGTVVISGNRITMQNTYTAHKHGKYTAKFSKGN